ncbi:hypothetical protein PSN01_06339 [Micromonospora saelicesensis]|nr:hypothetical protein PSN01_06339 [Micromonospora saelicesensis]
MLCRSLSPINLRPGFKRGCAGYGIASGIGVSANGTSYWSGTAEVGDPASMYSGPVTRTISDRGTRAMLGAASPDHFGIHWEATPHRSISITAGQSFSLLSGIGEHLGHGDLFANLHPICSQMQGHANQRLLGALTCAHSLARRNRAWSTAAQKRGALRCETGRRTHSDLRQRGAAGRGGCSYAPSGAVRCSCRPFSAPCSGCWSQERRLTPTPGVPGLLPRPGHHWPPSRTPRLISGRSRRVRSSRGSAGHPVGLPACHRSRRRCYPKPDVRWSTGWPLVR